MTNQDSEKLLAIKAWCEFMIMNQGQIRENEFNGQFLPEWNNGYLDCLEDLRAILESDTEI